MTNFIAFEIENMGGCQSFQFIPVDDVKSIPESINNKITSSVVLNTGKSFYNGLSLPDTLEFNEDNETTSAGPFFKTVLSGSIPKLTDEYLALFNEMLYTRFLLICLDNNGKYRLCGTKQAGMKFSFSQGTGKMSSNKNGFNFSFTLEYKSPSPFYEI